MRLIKRKFKVTFILDSFFIKNIWHNIGTELLLKCKKLYVKMSMLKKVSRENSNGIIFTDGAFLLQKNGGN